MTPVEMVIDIKCHNDYGVYMLQEMRLARQIPRLQMSWMNAQPVRSAIAEEFGDGACWLLAVSDSVNGRMGRRCFIREW